MRADHTHTAHVNGTKGEPMKGKQKPVEEPYIIKSHSLRVAVERLTSGKTRYHGVEHDISLVATKLKALSPCLNEVRDKAKHLMDTEVFTLLEKQEKLLTTALQTVQAQTVA